MRWLRARRRAEALFYEEIATHRADPDGRDDILAVLMAARDEDGPLAHRRGAARPAGDAARRRSGPPAHSLGLMDVEGPITCLDVRGNRLGVFYSSTKSKSSLMTALRFGVYMNITTDGRGNAKSVSYSVVPFKTTGGCKPAPTPCPPTGKVSLTDG